MTEHGLLAPGWADTGVASIVDDEALLTAMLDVEVALAVAQARVGIIPESAVASIRSAAQVSALDLPALAAGVRATANPVVVFVGQLTRAVAAIDPEAANHVHRGSTSQDILDTALMLLCARMFRRIDTDLTRCADALAALASAHRDLPAVARTLTQHAVPTTFGLKAASWLTLVLDARDRLRAVTLPASLGGAAGTLSAYEQYARIAGADPDATLRLSTEFAAELGLAESPLPWHAVRTPMADVASALTITTGALGKVAVDVLLLTRTEIGEVVEASAPGKGASSAMPQKQNPVLATMVATAARQLPAHALVLFGSMVVEDERSSGGWHAEWQPLRECLRLAGGAAANAADLAEGLRVVPERVAANLALTGGAVVSERVTAALTPILGKTAAKTALTEAVAESERTGADLADVLSTQVGASVDVRELLDPAGYLGVAGALVDRALARYAARG